MTRAVFMPGVTYDLTTQEGVTAAIREARARGLVRPSEEVVALGTKEPPGVAKAKMLLQHGRVAAGLLKLRADVDEFRAAPHDPTDAFDRGGAVAALDQGLALFGRPPRDDVADILARETHYAIRLNDDLSRLVKAAGEEPANLTDDVRTAVSRTTWSLHAMAAWARDGLITYDLTAGLYARLRRALDDEGVASMRLADATFPRRAFALRLPGPDYPVITDSDGPFQARGLVVYQADDVNGQGAADEIRQVMHDALDACAEPVLPGEPGGAPSTTAEITSVLADAGFAALVNPVPSVTVLFAGWVPDEKCASGTCIENMSLRLRPGEQVGNVTIREAVEWSTEQVHPKMGQKAPLIEALTVALAAGLYLGSVPDEGKPIRAHPVRRKDGRSITPDARVLGIGVREVP